MTGRESKRAAVALGCVLLLAGCGERQQAAPGALAAKVNQGSVSAAQVSYAAARAGQVGADQAKQVGKQVLERLIDQELLAQKALETKLDGDPNVVQALEAARREVLARAYADKLGGTVEKPTAAEVSEFYAKHPELFSERRVYRVNEITLANRPEVTGQLHEQMKQAKSINDVVTWLREKKIQYAAGSETRAAEQLPMHLAPQFHKMKDGQTALMEAPNAVLIVQLVASQTQPIDEATAKSFIEQHLINRKRAEVAEKELKQLREKAKIEYLGEYAAAPGAAPQAAKQPEFQPFRPEPSDAAAK